MYIYAPKIDNNTELLINLLHAKPLRRFDGMHFWNKNQRMVFTKNDTILCWGTCLPAMEPQRVLNSNATISNYVDVMYAIQLLARLGVYGPQPMKGTPKLIDSPLLPHPLTTISLHRVASIKVFVSPDLFNGYRQTVSLVPMDNEYEVHVFNNTVIYSRVKVPVLPLAKTESEWDLNRQSLAHPWYKSSTTGWKTEPNTGQYISTKHFDNSDISRHALDITKALGLLFGVVYIGEAGKRPGYTFVRKISLRPELDTELAKIYAEKIREI